MWQRRQKKVGWGRRRAVLRRESEKCLCVFHSTLFRRRRRRSRLTLRIAARRRLRAGGEENIPSKMLLV